MFLFVNNTIFNIKKIVTVEIDKEVLTQVNYYLSDGALLEEKMETEAKAKAKITELKAEKSFMEVREDKLVNLMYIKNVKQDVINENTLVYTFYKGNDAIVKEKFNSEAALNAKLEAIQEQLKSMGSDSEDEDKDEETNK